MGISPKVFQSCIRNYIDSLEHCLNLIKGFEDEVPAFEKAWRELPYRLQGQNIVNQRICGVAAYMSFAVQNLRGLAGMQNALGI